MSAARNGRGDAANRVAITASIMLAAIMTSLDSTIANVAIPHIQGSLSASAEQITWVLTSYIVASTIMTPLTGFLADRLGRKFLFLAAIAGFIGASMLCGIADSLFEIVLFRLLQGAFGAALMPLSQAVLLDINPPEKHGQAMSIWGAAAVLGPVMGPVLGGWLTDHLNWRWVFFINLPIGILAFLGVFFFVSEKKAAEKTRLDILGFATLSLAVGAFQMILDRGPGQGWFGSPEIWTYVMIAVITLWMFCVQIATAKNPFVDRALVADTNFLICCLFGFFTGIMMLSVLALLPPMMQNVLGYPVAFAGLVVMSRGVGSFISMMTVGQLIGRVSIRAIMIVGLACNTVSLWQMAHFSLSMDYMPIVISGFLSGIGSGLILVPLSTMAFAQVAPILRAQAAGVFTLVRNIGTAAGISILQAVYVSGAQKHHSAMVEHARPDNPNYQAYAPETFSSGPAMAAFNNVINHQAQMLSYVDDYSLMFIVSVLSAPLVLLMRTPKKSAGEGPAHVATD